MLLLYGYSFYLTRYFYLLLFIKSRLIFLISHTFSWLLGLMSGISSIKDASGSAGFKTKTWRIFMIFMLSGRFSLYVTGSRTFKILKGPNLKKSNLLLGRVVWINIIFVLGILYRRYTLFFFLRVSPQTFLLLVNFFIILLKNTKFYRSLFYNS